MGSCLCKEKGQAADGDAPERPAMASGDSSGPKRPRISEEETLEQLIMEILEHTRNCHDSNEDPPALPKITALADTDEGWCRMVMALIRIIPMDISLGPSAIGIIFEYCPLPARDTVLGFTLSLHLHPNRCALAYSTPERARRERNLMFVLGCIIEKFASHNSVHVLTDDMLEYLLTFLEEYYAELALAALVALDKLCHTAANKVRVEEALIDKMLNPLLPLEIHATSKRYKWRCAGFLARYALDYMFLVPKRPLSYRIEDTSGIRVMLNVKATTGYLKVSPDGLEVRCDSHTFESVRATYEVRYGCFYYEVELITAGVMQIGWATASANFESYEGFGVGDDRFSVAYDGCRRLLWHKARARRMNVRPWRPGDILGCLIDIGTGIVRFSLNGLAMPPMKPCFLSTGHGCYPAASFMAGQQCIFNFGSRPFAYPPIQYYYSTMNEHGMLTKDEKLTVHRREDRSESPKKETSKVVAEPPTERRCVVCLGTEGGCRIEPCNHGEFCADCVMSLEECPLCRAQVRSVHVTLA